MDLLYDISGLTCSYPSLTYPVLEIENLTIKRGEFVFFLGASGVGKSTILETLGLMNNTIQKERNSIFNFYPNDTPINMLEIWRKSESYRSTIRKNHFSFIFQSDNLFKNLSVLKNIMIPLILQGYDKRDAEDEAKGILNKIMPGLEFHKAISEISGGQKQRVTFARAIVSKYDILFADEPTGNLDTSNANKLMKILFKTISEKKKSSIVVTHDINLALNYATKIVLINRVKADKFSFGKIDSNSTFTKDGEKWIQEKNKIDRTQLLELLNMTLESQTNSQI